MRLRGIDAAEQGRRDRLVGERERAREREVGREWIGGYSGMVVARREMDVLPRYEEREGGVVGSGSGNGGVTVAVTMPPPAYEGFGRGGQGYEGRRYFGGI